MIKFRPIRGADSASFMPYFEFTTIKQLEDHIRNDWVAIIEDMPIDIQFIHAGTDPVTGWDAHIVSFKLSHLDGWVLAGMSDGALADQLSPKNWIYPEKLSL